MNMDRKKMPRLRQVKNKERAASTKARESCQLFTIMAEFIGATARVAELRRAISMFGAAMHRGLLQWSRESCTYCRL
jgi:hypothetical protein